MDSSKLEKFATAARVTLLDQMAGLVTQALNDPKIAAEYPNDVAALRSAVAEHGEIWVADTAAHTWFNRLTAARFMDVRGFSGLYRVVSPAEGSASNLPEILLKAQSGEFGDEISERTRSEVSALLSGRRTSANPELEAYALLLRAMFVAWYPAMPEVFTGPADWIRLLVPADLLAPTSVRERAVAVMDDDACATVEVVGWLYQFYNSDLKDEINKAKVPIDAAELPAVTQLFTPHWIVRYLVENSLGRLWLRSRPASGLREHMPYFVEPIDGQADTGVTVESPEEIRLVDPACGSGHMLTYAFDLLFHIYEEAGYARTEIPQKILTHNLRGLEIDSRAAQLASFALAMKAREKDRRFLTRNVDGDPVRPDIVRIEPLVFDGDDVELLAQGLDREDRAALEGLLQSFVHADTFGSLIRVDPVGMAVLRRILIDAEQSEGGDTTVEARREVITRARRLYRQADALEDDQYHVVVANPPYLGSGNMGGQLSDFAKARFPETKSDLYAMFIERNAELARPAGSVAMVTMQSWMFLTSYRKFRARLPEWGHLATMAHLGARGFDSIGGEVVQTAAYVIDVASSPGSRGAFFRLVEGRNESEKDTMLLKAVTDEEAHNRYEASIADFCHVPESPVVYWISKAMAHTFNVGTPLREVATPSVGLQTGDNERFLRMWFEVSAGRTGFRMASREESRASRKRWFPHNKGGSFRKWWGNREYVINWEDDGRELWRFRPRSVIRNPDYYFDRMVTWSRISSVSAFRFDESSIPNDKAPFISSDQGHLDAVIGFLNSTTADVLARALAPGFGMEVGIVASLPILPIDRTLVAGVTNELVVLFRDDWNSSEISWEFRMLPIVGLGNGGLVESAESLWGDAVDVTLRSRELEQRNNRYFAELYGLQDEVPTDVALDRVSLTRNPYFRYAPNKGAPRSEEEYRTLFDQDLARELLSYAVGCIMGRYSLDKPGLILADAGFTIADFDAKVPNAQFRPDEDGIIPITGAAYFLDDIVSRVHEFLGVAFGEENITANVSWIEHALGSGKRKDLRQYFLKDFYADHLKMYSNRPIYWQASSHKQTEKGFNALIYLHRYTPATLGILRENYANDMLDKQEARLTTIEHALDTADKAEATRLRKEQATLTEMRRDLQDWVTTTLFPLSTAEIELDLDDGVKQNYPKLGAVLKYVRGLS
ncbi:BREX-1 system adenine-specific DNA-methyltransferase PglX [Tsukamurella sputi]|uniref:site-specific DNA-methyltransferase (adenine-specific) n=1 Tax=Tsukamurella sputi TaxID=2591848 RepID=A0A5C5RQI0_9ACTN|nr:BREX-1 system adenine-specific DNA-methyltransferase PglX [Tsukamurella sputi]TWS24838.1 BREX-1 system adenine-specific DNA-methyltransferase PglX [Tsukamurella sputi]